LNYYIHNPIFSKAFITTRHKNLYLDTVAKKWFIVSIKQKPSSRVHCGNLKAITTF